MRSSGFRGGGGLGGRVRLVAQLLGDARRLTGAATQVVELRAAHLADAGDLDLGDVRRVEREDALDALAERNLAHGEARPDALVRTGDAHALELLDAAPAARVPQLWYQVRKRIGDIRQNLPAEAIGPFFNDEFGDVFGTIYGFTGDGISLAELRRHAETVRQELLRVPDVAKVEFIGLRDEKIYIEVATTRMASLGIDPARIADQLVAQNVVTPAGTVNTPDVSVPLRVTGQFDSVREIEELQLTVGGKLIRLGDIARVWRGYADPPVYTMRVAGKDAIGLGVSMTPRGDVLALGRNLAATMERLERETPVGIEYVKVSDQPRIVEDAVGFFIKALFEAVAIVLLVSFIALGLRAGLVVALVMLLMLMLMVGSAYTLSGTNLKAVGNMQFRNEAIAAANIGIEKVLSSAFTTSPTGEQVNVDINNDLRGGFR